jgi:hypothetical protein
MKLIEIYVQMSQGKKGGSNILWQRPLHSIVTQIQIKQFFPIQIRGKCSSELIVL